MKEKHICTMTSREWKSQIITGDSPMEFFIVPYCPFNKQIRNK